MEQKEEKVRSYLRNKITRRQALKAGGLAALGLAFSKRIIDTIRPTPIFAVYGQPSIDWDPDGTGTDDLEFFPVALTIIPGPNTGNYVADPKPVLCNVSDEPTPISEAKLEIELTKDDGGHLVNGVNGVSVNGMSFPVTLTGFAPMGEAGSCKLLEVEFELQNWGVHPGSGHEVKVVIKVVEFDGRIPTNPPKLTLTLIE